MPNLGLTYYVASISLWYLVFVMNFACDDELDLPLIPYRQGRDEIGRSIYCIDKYFFKDLKKKALSLKFVTESFRKGRNKFIMYGELSSLTQPTRLAIKTIDVNGCFIATRILTTDVEVWLYDKYNAFRLCRPVSIDDCKYANELSSRNVNSLIDMTNIQLYSGYKSSKVHISEVCSRNYFMYATVKCFSNPMRIEVIDHRLHIKTVSDTVVEHQFQVSCADNSWHSIRTFYDDDLSPFYAGTDYDWPNQEDLTWRVMVGYSVVCDGEVCPLSSIPRWKTPNTPKFVVQGRLLPPPSPDDASSSASTRKPLNVLLEFDVLYVEFDKQDRGFWVKNVADPSVFYKLQEPNAEYASYASEALNIFQLYDYVHLVSEKDVNGKLCINETIEQIYEVSDSAFDVTYLLANREFVLLFMKDFINSGQSKASLKSMNGPKTSSLTSSKKRSREYIGKIFIIFSNSTASQCCRLDG